MKFATLLAATALSTTAAGALAAGAFDPTPMAGQWTGYYIGTNVGHGSDHANFSNSNVTANGFFAAAGSLSSHPAGALGGFQSGFNTQIAPNWIVGVETDFQWRPRKN